jgi:hypothetical protein
MHGARPTSLLPKKHGRPDAKAAKPLMRKAQPTSLLPKKHGKPDAKAAKPHMAVQRKKEEAQNGTKLNGRSGPLTTNIVKGLFLNLFDQSMKGVGPRKNGESQAVYHSRPEARAKE